MLQITGMKAMENIIIETFERSALKGKIAALYVLGSVTTGRMRPDSDIDIAALPMENISISLEDRLDFIASLSLELGRDIDLGIITPQNLVYASQAILAGRRILALEPDYAAHTETRLLGCYLQLRLDRREVEDAYHAA
jgi:uncharacterized protein